MCYYSMKKQIIAFEIKDMSIWILTCILLDFIFITQNFLRQQLKIKILYKLKNLTLLQIMKKSLNLLQQIYKKLLENTFIIQNRYYI